MTADLNTSIRASRVRVPRSRGAASGFLLLILGAWAALVPFIGPLLNVAFTPSPDKAWHWTADRGWFHVLPGALTVLGGLLLLLSGSRLVTSFGAWLAVVSGAWLIVGPALADVVNLSPGQPDPSSREAVRAFASLLFFYGIGAVILFVAALALGRLSVHSVRDVRAAERRVAAEEAAAAEEEQRLAREREAYAARDREQEREREQERASADAGPAAGAGTATAVGTAGAEHNGGGNGRHERTAGDAAATQHLPPQQPGQYQGQPGQYQGPPTQQPYTSAPPPPEQRN